MKNLKTAILLSDKSNLFVAAVVFDTSGFYAVNDQVFKFDLSRILRQDLVLAIDRSLDSSREGLDRNMLEMLDKKIGDILEISCADDMYSLFDIIEVVLLDVNHLKVSPYRRCSHGGIECDLDAEKVFAREELSLVVEFVLDYFSDAARFLPLARPRPPRATGGISGQVNLRVGLRVRDSFGSLGEIAYIDENGNGGLGLVVVHMDDGRIVRTAVIAHGLSVESF